MYIVLSLARGKIGGISSKQSPNMSSLEMVSIADHSSKQVCEYMRQGDKSSLLDAILADNVTESESEGSGCETLDNLSRTAQSSQEGCDFVVNSRTVTDKFHAYCSLGIRKEIRITNNLGTSTTTDDLSGSLTSCKRYILRSKYGVTVDKLNG